MNKEPELVDLGLPSGNLWMKYNLGAKSDMEYGNYYQFGSLEGYQGEEAKKHSFWETCPFNDEKNEFDEEYFLKYRSNLVYKNNNIRPDFDVVTQTYGPGYKIPEPKDFQELLENTTSEFILSYKKTNISGKLFTSKINGEKIFIPYSGSYMTGNEVAINLIGFLMTSKIAIFGKLCLIYCFHISESFLASAYWSVFICALNIRGIKVRNE